MTTTLQVDGIVGIYRWWTEKPASFLLQVETPKGRKWVTVQPEKSDTVASLLDKMQAATAPDAPPKGAGWTTQRWSKGAWSLPDDNPSEVELRFDAAVEWFLAITKWDVARCSMMKKPLTDSAEGKAERLRLAALFGQATTGDVAVPRPKTVLFAFGKERAEVWDQRKQLLGMSREDAMQAFEDEVERQKGALCSTTLV